MKVLFDVTWVCDSCGRQLPSKSAIALDEDGHFSAIDIPAGWEKRGDWSVRCELCLKGDCEDA